MSRLDQSLSGQAVVTDTNAHEGNFYALQVIADCVVASVTYLAGYDVDNTWSDLASIPAGTILYGRFISLTLSSGEVVLHKL